MKPTTWGLCVLLACTGLSDLAAQSNPNLEEKFGFREWRLGDAAPEDISQRARPREITDPCFQWYTVEDPEPLRHIQLTRIDLSYEADALTGVGVALDAEDFNEALEAASQVYGPPTEVEHASTPEAPVYEWVGRGIRLQLALASSELGETETQLSYEWQSPTITYSEFVEDKREKFTMADF